MSVPRLRAVPLVGVLALQGAFREHVEAFTELGVATRLVKRPMHLDGLDAIVLPGGESTTQTKLLDSSEVREPLARALADGLACFATCAGLILLAREVIDGRPDQMPLGVLDIAVQRNGYGRQIESFEAPIAITDIDIAGLDSTGLDSTGLDITGLDSTGLDTADPGEWPFPGVFIRAPKIVQTGSVEILGRYNDSPVLVRHGAIWGATFHPELARDLRLHRAFLRSPSLVS